MKIRCGPDVGQLQFSVNVQMWEQVQFIMDNTQTHPTRLLFTFFTPGDWSRADSRWSLMDLYPCCMSYIYHFFFLHVNLTAGCHRTCLWNDIICITSARFCYWVMTVSLGDVLFWPPTAARVTVVTLFLMRSVLFLISEKNNKSPHWKK